MCFAILGLKVSGIKIKNPACVKKTFPNFFQKLVVPPPLGLGATILDAGTGVNSLRMTYSRPNPELLSEPIVIAIDGRAPAARARMPGSSQRPLGTRTWIPARCIGRWPGTACKSGSTSSMPPRSPPFVEDGRQPRAPPRGGPAVGGRLLPSQRDPHRRDQRRCPHVAAVPRVRQWMKKKQRECIRFGNLVMEGRDIGSNVFPETISSFTWTLRWTSAPNGGRLRV